MKKKYWQPTAEILLFGTNDAVLNSVATKADEDFGEWPEEWGN